MPIANGVVSVGTSPTPICTAGEYGVVLAAASAGVFVGGPNVAASGANAGIALPTTPTFFPGQRPKDSPVIPAGAPDTGLVYGIVASATINVTFFSPGGG